MSPRPFRLHLVRHGQTHANVSGALDTSMPGLDLTDLGRAQARAASRALAQVPVTGIYVSKLVRTHQTAAPLAALSGLEPTHLPGIHEISAGQFEMATDRESVHGYITSVTNWIGGNWDYRMPGGETGAEFVERYTADVETIAADGHEEALLVSHGAAIRTWLSSVLPDLAASPQATAPLHNTAHITVQGHPSTGWELVQWTGDPVGGAYLEDEAAADPTGDVTGD